MTLNPASIVSEARIGTPRLVQDTSQRRASSSLLTKEDKALLARLDRQSEDMVAWLAQQRRDFENRIDLW